MTFKSRPYDPDRKDTRSQSQKRASERNFRIFRLRGLYSQMFLLTGKRRERAMKLVDQELIAMGAKPQSLRMEASMKEWREK